MGSWRSGVNCARGEWRVSAAGEEKRLIRQVEKDMRLPRAEKAGKKHGMKRITHLLAAAVFTVTGLSSCNTAIGFSRDLRSLGTGIENKAQGRTWQGGEGVGGVPAPNPNAQIY